VRSHTYVITAYFTSVYTLIQSLMMSHWAKTCSVMLTEGCYTMNIVVFDGNLIY